MQKTLTDDNSPIDFVDKVVNQSNLEKSMEESNIKSNKNIFKNTPIKIFFLENNEEIEIPLMESKINKNLYADYIVILKRLPVRKRFLLAFFSKIKFKIFFYQNRKRIEKKMIKEFIYDETDDTQYYLNIDWAVDYTTFLDDSKNLEMKPINNYSLLEKDFRLLPDLEENTNYVLVNEKTWIFVMKIYDGGPSIKKKLNGQIIVSNNETVLYSTTQIPQTNNPNEKIQGIFNSTAEVTPGEEEKQLEKENNEEILHEQDKLIRFDKNNIEKKPPHKKLMILTHNTSNLTNDDHPQSSTSLDSHSTSFSKDDILGGSDKKNGRSVKIFGLANSSNYCFLNSGFFIFFFNFYLFGLKI